MQSTWQVPLNELFGGPKNGQLVSAVRLQLARSCCSARLASPWLSRSLTAVWIFREVINSNWQAGNIIQHFVAAAVASFILLTWQTLVRPAIVLHILGPHPGHHWVERKFPHRQAVYVFVLSSSESRQDRPHPWPITSPCYIDSWHVADLPCRVG